MASDRSGAKGEGRLSSLLEYAAKRFTDAFGEPQEIPTSAGFLYRWVIDCGPERELRLLLDAPEGADSAHVLISDTAAPVRVSAETIRTEDGVLALVERLRGCL
jgi:hypothetical protein